MSAVREAEWGLTDGVSVDVVEAAALGGNRRFVTSMFSCDGDISV